MRRSILLSLAALLLAGCAGDTGPMPKTCPQAAVVRDLALWEEDGEAAGAAAAPLKMRAGLTNIVSHCTYNDEGVTINMAVSAYAFRGPAMTDNEAITDYFVAVIGPDDQPVAKKLYSVEWKWPSDTRELMQDQELRVALPFSSDWESLSRYRVWVGWQLSEEQLIANRTKVSAANSVKVD